MKSLLCLLTALALAPLHGCSYLKHVAPPAGKELSATERFERVAKCGIAGKEYFERFAKEWNTFDARNALAWDEPEYHYNSRLETCLIHIRFVQPLPGGRSESRHFNQTIDVSSERAWFSAVSACKSRHGFPKPLVVKTYPLAQEHAGLRKCLHVSAKHRQKEGREEPPLL